MDSPTALLRMAVEDAELRATHIQQPALDGTVKVLCEQFGYGAVMDSAMRQWLQKDPHGAIIMGPCMGTAKSVLQDKDTTNG